MKKRISSLKCCDHFYVRYPFLSYDFYENRIENIDVIPSVLAKNSLLENIVTSSNQLYLSLKGESKSKSKEESCYKYLLRSSIRCTPYGLNAGVGLGKFTDGVMSFELGNNQKNARVDLEWLVPVIKMLEKQIGTELYIKSVDYKESDSLKITNMWNSCFVKNNNNVNDVNYLNNTNLVNKILNFSSSYQSIGDLLNKLMVWKPVYDFDKLQKVVKDLLDNGFLTSNLRVSLLCSDPLIEILKVCKNFHYESDIILQLEQINLLLTEYNSTLIGKGIELFNDILCRMEKIYKTKNYVQCELYNLSITRLDKKIKSDIEEFSSFLLKWTYQNSFNNYITRYKEKYGEEAIRLIDVIDEKYGLGMPEADLNNSNQFREDFLKAFLNTIIENDKAEYIDLSKSSYFCNRNHEKNETLFPMSAELSFFIMKDGVNYRYLVSPMIGSEEKWKSFGRFRHLFDNEALVFDESSQEGLKEVEMSFYPQKPHVANVVINDSLKKYYTELSEYNLLPDKKRININDVYLFIDKDSQIQFVDKSDESILDFSASNKLVPNFYPKIFQAINTIKVNQRNSLESLFFVMKNELKKFDDHIPEIRYKNFILFSESWKLNKDELYENNVFIDIEKFKYLISAKKSLPNRVLVGPMDHKLILNLSNCSDLQLLYKMVKKDNDLLLEKVMFDKNNLLLTRNGEHFLGEFVFQLEEFDFKPKEFNFSSERIPFVNNVEMLKETNYVFGEWVTLKLYMNKENENRVIISQFRLLHDTLRKKEAISQFHYLRYIDQYNHLRIRFKINNGKQGVVLNECTKLITLLSSLGLLYNATFDSYLPEYHRYGGKHVINQAENVFYAQSLLSIDLLSLLDNKLTQLNKKHLYVIASYKMIKDMGITDEDILIYLDRYKLEKNKNKEFQEYANVLNKYILTDKFEDSFYLNHKDTNIMVILEKYSNLHYLYWKDVCDLYDGDNFTSYIKKRYIIVSLLHMFYNRFVSRKDGDERLLIGVLRKMIYIKLQRDRYGK